MNFDFCLAWNWEYDADFVAILRGAFKESGLTVLEVVPDNLSRMLESLKKEEITLGSFLDRASESDPDFLPLVRWAEEQSVYFINSHDRSLHAMNKASMHLEFITAGIHTPYTIILPPFHSEPHLAPFLDLSPLGERFTIKPAHGGGGEGVVSEATSLDQVRTARQEYPHDYYLLQAHIVPARLSGRSAWFRVLYCGERIYPCWWDMQTHVYTPVTAAEEQAFELTPLRQTTRKIAEVCGLNMFSTEIAQTGASLFVAVDYVNDQIDLRLKSNTYDGVPDEIVRDIAERLAELVLRIIPARAS
jgi:glutathione synthase/RimK-type ligase-like ATP-grasp enzyme